MTHAAYKSSRLLVEAINREMETIRKAAMGNMALGPLNELRDLVRQLAKMAERVHLDDVLELAPPAYVATMKPLVARYHQQLMIANQLAPCLCMDLQANACVLILLGDGKTVVRTAHHPGKPDAELVVATLLAGIDDSVKRVAAEAAQVAEQLNSGAPANDPAGPPDADVLDSKLCGGCDCVAGACDCEACEGRSP